MVRVDAARLCRMDRPDGSVDAWGRTPVAELCASGALALRDGSVCNV